MELSVIIFSYNEEDNIKDVVLNSIDFLSQPKYQNSELIIINDGSTDNTELEINKLVHQFPDLRVVHFEKNEGIGSALNTGYNMAIKENVCAIPGDGQFDIFEINLINDFSTDEFVTFYRIEKNYNRYRKLLTFLNKEFNKLFLKIDVPDVNWIKIYKKEQLDRINRQLNSSLVESEICAKLIKLGYKHRDYPSKYLNRNHGYTKGGNWITLKKVIPEIFLLYNKVH